MPVSSRAFSALFSNFSRKRFLSNSSSSNDQVKSIAEKGQILKGKS
jgi:hypothetical protein